MLIDKVDRHTKYESFIFLIFLIFLRGYEEYERLIFYVPIDLEFRLIDTSLSCVKYKHRHETILMLIRF